MHAALVDAGGARSVLAQLLRRTARASSNKAFTTEHLYNHRVGYIESSQARSRCLKLGKASSPAPGRYCALPSPALAVMSAKRPRTIDAFFVRKPSAVGGASARQKCADSAALVAHAAKGGGGDSAQPEQQQLQLNQSQTSPSAALTGSPGTGAAVADGRVEPVGPAGREAVDQVDGRGAGGAEAAAQEGGGRRKRRASSDGAGADQGPPGEGSAAARLSPRKRAAGASVAAAVVVTGGSLGSGAAGQAAVLGAVQQGHQEQGQGAGAEAPGAAAGAGPGPGIAAGQVAAAGAGGGEGAAAGPEDGAEGADDGLTPLQRAKIQANRNRALVRRAIAEAAAAGAEAGAGSAPPPLSLSTLLVEPTWRDSLGAELHKPYIKKLESFLHGEWAPGRKPVFPPKECVFAAFNACPFDKVRVVILGQDPYHGPGQAMGLSFSVPAPHRPLPPSLLNMYKEARQDLGWPDTPKHGDLTSWSVQGVLLLNTCLTVRQGEANSHSKRGWEDLTDEAIRALSRGRSGVVFMLWGKPAEAKAKLIDGSRHHVLISAHPSPLSASRGFFGCRHFSRANALLEAQGLAPIDWWPAA